MFEKRTNPAPRIRRIKVYDVPNDVDSVAPIGVATEIARAKGNGEVVVPALQVPLVRCGTTEELILSSSGGGMALDSPWKTTLCYPLWETVRFKDPALINYRELLAIG
jgi:hypothetical protein